jgi:hypothetical protein
MALNVLVGAVPPPSSHLQHQKPRQAGCGPWNRHGLRGAAQSGEGSASEFKQGERQYGGDVTSPILLERWGSATSTAATSPRSSEWSCQFQWGLPIFHGCNVIRH